MDLSTMLGLGGLVSVIAGWASYMATIPRGTVPRRPVGALLLTVGGAGAGLAGVGLAARAGTLGVGTAMAGGLATAMGLFFVWLYAQRKVPVGDLQVAVGEPMIPFSTKTAEGTTFESEALRGKRVLLKFFRGGW